MLTYAQIEAIHEAMRELEAVLNHDRANDIDVRAPAAACVDTIRKALAGETKPVGMSAEGLAALDELKKRLNDGSP